MRYLVAQGTADDHIWPLVQSKLDVLNRAGLSKDDFTDADEDRQRTGDSSQTRITDLFRQLLDDEDVVQKDAENAVQKDGYDDTGAERVGEADDKTTSGEKPDVPGTAESSEDRTVGGDSTEESSDRWMAEMCDEDLEDWAGEDSSDIPDAEQRPRKKARGH